MEYKPIRAIISGGGTGGHIFPAVSIAGQLKACNPSTEVLFVGAEGKMEMEKVPAAGYEIVGLPIVGLQRQLNLRNIINDIQVPFRWLASLRKAGHETGTGKQVQGRGAAGRRSGKSFQA